GRRVGRGRGDSGDVGAGGRTRPRRPVRSGRAGMSTERDEAWEYERPEYGSVEAEAEAEAEATAEESAATLPTPRTSDAQSSEVAEALPTQRMAPIDEVAVDPATIADGDGASSAAVVEATPVPAGADSSQDADTAAPALESE